MNFNALCCILAVLIPLVVSNEYRGSSKKDYHINSIVHDGASSGGCRKRHPDNLILPGGAQACASHKPLKIKGLDKVGKRICADGYEYCSVSHKFLHRISWKAEAMPESCFGFHYKKDKFAGYGHNCHRNLYFDGLLCCPKDQHKTNHHLRIGSNKLHHHHRHFLKNGSSENQLKK